MFYLYTLYIAFYILGRNKIEASCDSFEVSDPQGKSRFKVTEKGVLYGTDEVTYSGKALSSTPCSVLLSVTCSFCQSTSTCITKEHLYDNYITMYNVSMTLTEKFKTDLVYFVDALFRKRKRTK